MIDSLKTGKLRKKILNKKRQLLWIKKHRSNMTEPIEKKLSLYIERIGEIEKKITAKQIKSAEVGKFYKELEYNFKKDFLVFKQNALWELFDELWLVVIIALFLKFFVIGSYRVPTGSMVNTIEIGDNLFVAMFVYGLTLPFAKNQFVEFGNPERGEIITFSEPVPPGKALVKRVIGVPGDTILMAGNDIYINGEKLERENLGASEYTSSKGEKIEVTKYVEKTPDGRKYTVQYHNNVDIRMRKEVEKYCRFCNRTFTVPERSFFVLGDNRDDSLDSRFWGFVPRENLQGKPLFVWFSIQFGETVTEVVELRLRRIGHVFK
jgi:signal peptidase I